MSLPKGAAAAAGLIVQVAQAVRDSRPHTHCLRYIPGTKLGDSYPNWRFGYRRSAESCEATRLQCANASDIEVVTVDE